MWLVTLGKSRRNFCGVKVRRWPGGLVGWWAGGLGGL